MADWCLRMSAWILMYKFNSHQANVVGMVIYFPKLVHRKINHLNKFIHDVTCRVDQEGIAPPGWLWVHGGSCRNGFSNTGIWGCGASFPRHSSFLLRMSSYLFYRATPISVNEKGSKETEWLTSTYSIYCLWDTYPEKKHQHIGTICKAVLIVFKSPRWQGWPCFKFFSVSAAAAMTFASHVKTVRYMEQRKCGSGEMYWMTFLWPWPKVTLWHWWTKICSSAG